MSAGNVTILINDDPDKSIEVPAGGKLLVRWLQGYVLASACGGGVPARNAGAGWLKVAQHSGHGGSHFNRGEVNESWRLSCQVAVKQDMKIEVPDDALGVQRWECEVIIPMWLP